MIINKYSVSDFISKPFVMLTELAYMGDYRLLNLETRDVVMKSEVKVLVEKGKAYYELVDEALVEQALEIAEITKDPRAFGDIVIEIETNIDNYEDAFKFIPHEVSTTLEAVKPVIQAKVSKFESLFEEKKERKKEALMNKFDAVACSPKE